MTGGPDPNPGVENRADVGVFGGSGFYAFLDGARSVEVDTAWGSPSAPVTLGEVGTTTVAFLPRHGVDHRFPPHRVNYRANVEAMRRLGVRALLTPFAAGSLRPDVHPGDVVVVDQFVDRTSGRAGTFHDVFESGPRHASMADPYDEALRRRLVAAASRQGLRVHDGGTVVVIDGPRFSTRAESAWYRSAGWTLVNMTQCPEVPLAVEAGIPVAGIGLVTDYDSGLDGEPGIAPVTQEAVFEVFTRNVDALRDLLREVIPEIAQS